jgi:hypothetical protein
MIKECWNAFLRILIIPQRKMSKTNLSRNENNLQRILRKPFCNNTYCEEKNSKIGDNTQISNMTFENYRINQSTRTKGLTSGNEAAIDFIVIE